MQPRVSGIYAITHRESGKFYIGSSVWIEARWREHRWQLQTRKHHSRHLMRAWIKYGADAFEFSIVEVVDDPQQLIPREQHYLDTLRPWNPRIGYNMCRIAGSTLGIRLSAEHRRRMSAQRKGRKLTEEQRAKLRGRKPNEAQLAGLRIGWYSQRGKWVMTPGRLAYHERRRGMPATEAQLRGLAYGRGRKLTEAETDALKAYSHARKGRPVTDVQRAAYAERDARPMSEKRKAAYAARTGKPLTPAQIAGYERRRNAPLSEKELAYWARRRGAPLTEKQKQAYERMRGHVSERSLEGLHRAQEISWALPRTDRQIAASRENLAVAHARQAKRKPAAPPVQLALFPPSPSTPDTAH